ncbi:MAG: HTH-type transcriptional regulator / antitoxin HipB [Peptostreptococcaceae bacterium]|jgi:DNA-binding XRE family transcriptional regulator|nr:HTH-type transcriptional regulator / antitoxin HipB [Peptostreptococcaceae bacterium]
MAFKRIDIKSAVEEERIDKEFDSEYKKIKQEYKLIEKLVEARKSKDITQKELAELVGVSQQAISRLELEKHIPKMDTFIKILDGLDLELTIVSK